MILAIFDLQVTLIHPTKLKVSWPFGSGKEEKKLKIDFQDGQYGSHQGCLTGSILAIFDLNIFWRWPPWQPTWISDQKEFSYFWSTNHPNTSYQVLSQLGEGCRRSSLFKQIVDVAQQVTDDWQRMTHNKRQELNNHNSSPWAPCSGGLKAISFVLNGRTFTKCNQSSRAWFLSKNVSSSMHTMYIQIHSTCAQNLIQAVAFHWYILLCPKILLADSKVPYQTAQSAVWSGTWLSAYAWRHIFTW